MGYPTKICDSTDEDCLPRVLTPPSDKSTIPKYDGPKCESKLLIPNLPMLKLPLISKPPWMKVMRIMLREELIPNLINSDNIILKVPLRTMHIYIETCLPENVTYPLLLFFEDAIDDYENAVSIYHGLVPPLNYVGVDCKLNDGNTYCYSEFHEDYNQSPTNHGTGTGSPQKENQIKTISNTNRRPVHLRTRPPRTPQPHYVDMKHRYSYPMPFMVDHIYHRYRHPPPSLVYHSYHMFRFPPPVVLWRPPYWWTS